jgi:hypothetical protein
VDPDPDWIRIQWGVWIGRKNPNLYIKISFNLINLNFDFAAHTNTVYLLIISSAAEPHHIDAAPAPCINFDAAPTLVRILPRCKVPVC